MKNNFFDNINEIRVNVMNNKANIYIRDLRFGGNVLGNLAGQLKYLINNYEEQILLKITIKSRYINDMPTITIFEYLIYHTLKLSDHIIKISFNPLNKDYFANFLYNSLIGKFIKSNDSYIKSVKKFIADFESSVTNITETHYRKLLKQGDRDGQNTLYSELSILLRQKMKDELFIEDYCEAIVELCDNVLDHTDGDCIISIESGEAIRIETDTKHNMLSVVVSNVSKNLFYDNLKYQHQNNVRQFPVIDQALKYHEKFIEDTNFSYDINRFYIVSAFQNTISTRENQEGTGGTGLLKSVKNIINRTASDEFCYILTGDEILYLKENKICPKNGYIGFNNKHNYIEGIPDEEVFAKSGMYFNGTLIHLMLVLEKED